MDMKKMSRQAAWWGQGKPLIRIWADVGQAVKLLVGLSDLPVEHESWDEALACARKITEGPLGEANSEDDTWSDGTVDHIVHTKRLDGIITYHYSVLGGQASKIIARGNVKSREEAIRIGRDLVPVVHAALKASQAIVAPKG